MKYFALIAAFGLLYIARVSAQTNTDSVSYRQDSISFISQPSGYRMAGTLSYPPEIGQHPAILLIWGSGPQTRDQVISKFPMFKIMADYFNRNGYAVLRIDKRGFGKSEGLAESESKATTADLADDIFWALQFLKKQPGVDSTRIGLIGHSEGAWIAEMIARRDTSVRWLGLLGAHVISGEEILTDQMCANVRSHGAKEDVVAKVRTDLHRYWEFIKGGYADDSIYYAIGKDFLTAQGVEEKDATHKFVDQVLDGFKTPWYRYFFSHTPGDLIKQTTVPVYFIYGGEDENVTASTNLLPLLDAIQKSGNKNMTLTILPAMDHFFEVQRAGSWTLSDKLCPAISSWITSLKP